MPTLHVVAERDHDIQNPTSPEKLRLLGERIRLGADDEILDVASGRGGPALYLAEFFGCRITCVEREEEFLQAVVERARERGLEGQLSFVHADAREFPLEPERYDVALCLGASFVWDGLAGTVEALEPAVRPGGHVVVGEPYWRRWPLPLEFPRPGPYATLAKTVDRVETADLTVVTVIASSEDDWDRYQSLHWRAVEDWLAEHPDDPEADELRREHLRARERYLKWERDLMGWAILAARKR